jgi:hypothetical protein
VTERIWIQQALDFAAGRLSEETGFIHYHPHLLPEERHDPIPLVENSLYALAQMRSKNVEQVRAGIALLERVLGFEVKSGQFPTFIHDYPQCQDPWIAARLLPTFALILRDYAVFLGEPLRERLETSAHALYAQAQERLEAHNLPAHVALPLLASGALLTGDLEPLRLLVRALCPEDYRSAERLGRLLLGLHWLEDPLMAGEAAGLWNVFWERWDVKRGVYCGPLFQEYSYDSGLRPTLLDYLAAASWGSLPQAARIPGIEQLEAAWVYSCPKPQKASDYQEGDCAGNHWQRWLLASHSASLMEHCHEVPDAGFPGFHLLRLHWGEVEQSHSLAIQTERQFPVEAAGDGYSFSLVVTIPEDPEKEGVKRWVPLAVWIDKPPSLKLLLAGKSATVFQLGETVELVSDSLRARITCTVEGSGHMVGHIHWGNRPAQWHKKGQARFAAFDQGLQLRLTEQEGPTRVRLTIQMEQ